MTKTIGVVATMDTKGIESNFIRSELRAWGAKTCLLDIGVMGEPTTGVDYDRHAVAAAGGTSLNEILRNPTRQQASPIMIAGAARILREKIEQAEIHAVVGLGGTQGTSNCAQIFQQLPYGFPKIILSTVAAGDTSSFMGIKDITMMPAVADILGLNPLTRKILSNLAGAAFGMAQSQRVIQPDPDSRGVIGLTNLGVLTEGAQRAIDLLEQAGYEVITFHAVGTGGRAMEQMIREGLITAVFDYALGEIADEAYGGLRAADESRLTVAAELGLPQVVCPGGAEHLGIWVNEANDVPEKYRDHQYVFHNPYVFVPRLNSDEIAQVADAICQRLVRADQNCTFMIPEGGVSRYSVTGGPLVDRDSDRTFFDALKAGLPSRVKVVSLPSGAEDDQFVETAVSILLAQIENHHRISG